MSRDTESRQYRARLRRQDNGTLLTVLIIVFCIVAIVDVLCVIETPWAVEWLRGWL